MAETFFQVTNTLALLAWIALVLFPGKKVIASLLCAVVVPGLLALAYACVIGWKLATNGPPPGDVMTLAGLRAVFSDDWVFAAAWTHYLTFDMVVGAWIARDSVRRGMPWVLRTAALVLTFLAGPVGFLIHIVGRSMLRRAAEPTPGPKQPLHYFENGLLVYTAAYHLQRGSCCGSGCRHCPYEPRHVEGNTQVRS